MANKEVAFVIKVMNGGGAERVISILCNALARRDYDVSLIITHQSIEESNLNNICNKVHVISVEDNLNKNYTIIKKIKMLKARFVAKVERIFCSKAQDSYLIKKYEIRNYEKIKFLKKYFSTHNQSTVVAFLYDSVFLSLLSVKKNNKIIISERADPQQCLSSKTNVAFFKIMFPLADEMVFQSPGAQDWYKYNTPIEGKVIFNPIKSNLPDRYTGVRKKQIVNFCRLTAQKNLPLLIDAFEKFNKAYPEYILRIYGDGEEKESLLKYIFDKKLEDRISIEDFSNNIHDAIIDSAMFVSSSDYEGMSNSMLEAMAIGLPTICTDCPAGGARAIIKDHENGLLVPVNDAESLYFAMREVVEDVDLSEKISKNGTKLREQLHVDKIINQWLEVIG